MPIRSTSRAVVWMSLSILVMPFTSGFPANYQECLFPREHFRLLTNQTVSPDWSLKWHDNNEASAHQAIRFRFAHPTLCEVA
jgi:hypothetical protein